MTGTLASAALLTAAGVVRADRSAAQGPSALFLEKKGRYAEAAMYYERALRGFQEVWIQFWYRGEMSRAHPMTRQLLSEYRDRLTSCLRKARLEQAARERMADANEFWMGEFVDEELGGYKLAFARRAEEAEKHGDFLFARELRRAAAEYCRLVRIPYHERVASKLEKRGRRAEALLHRDVVTACRARAAEHQTLAQGDAALAGIPGLQAPASTPDVRQHYFNSYRLYHQRVLSADGGRWLTGRTPAQVAAALKGRGLKHADEKARLAAVTVLANLGERDALVGALADRSARVRLAAARGLSASRWAEGWAACRRHADADVRETIDPRTCPAGEHVLARTDSITELLRGLASPSADTRAFCRDALARITGRAEASPQAWRTWWQTLGDARAGLTRTAPDGTPALDGTVDFGAWWQSGVRSVHNRPNPLLTYGKPARIRWHGHLVVTHVGTYRFHVRGRGEKVKTFDKHEGLYFTTPCTTLSVDGRTVLPNPSDVVEDAKMHVRIDRGGPLRLEPGLHEIILTFELKGAGAGPWQGPSVRLYWESDRFLREVVPVRHLISLKAGGKR